MTITAFIDALSESTRACIVAHTTQPVQFVLCIDEDGNSDALRQTWQKASDALLAAEMVCYVTERQTLADADVCYAVFVLRIPTLVLNDSVSLSPIMYTLRFEGLQAVDTERAHVDAIRAFFGVQQATSRTIVFEGGDGCGKATQTALLQRHLSHDERPVRSLDFPYEPGLYGALIRVVLSGKKGSLSELEPRLFSLLYSLNRYGALPELRFWQQHGYVIVLDRYYTANFGHQACKLPAPERAAFIRALETLEVGLLGLPAADVVFYLDLPPKAALEAMRQDATRAYLDIHETAGTTYKEGVRQTYLWCCEQLPSWRRVNCVDAQGNRRSREELHADIYAQLMHHEQLEQAMS